MDLKVFFDTIRNASGKLKQEQVTGIEAILSACKRWGVTDPHHIADILAQVAHETGEQMEPVKETVYASHSNRNPSDDTVKARLENAWKHGDLPWVTTPYWRDGWFGRGMIQITHKDNYKKLGGAIGVDLVANRDAALDLHVSADIAVVGMARGLFTGRKLGDYKFPQALDYAPKDHPRRIVNGVDGTDTKVANLHRRFYNALVEAERAASPPAPSTPVRTRSAIIAEIEKLLEELKTA